MLIESEVAPDSVILGEQNEKDLERTGSCGGRSMSCRQTVPARPKYGSNDLTIGETSKFVHLLNDGPSLALSD